MSKETIILSKKELDRASIIKATIDKRVRQREAAWQLGLSVRQVKRLARRYREGEPGAWYQATEGSGQATR